MPLRLPTPLHGWRAFFGEVGIVVLGVLSALAAQQIVELASWRNDVVQARNALRSDLTDVLVYSRERQIEDACIRRRLAELNAFIGDGVSTLPPIGPIGSPALREWSLPSWPSTISSQIATHFPRDEMLLISILQLQGAQTQQNNAREMDDWAALYSIVGPGRRLDDGEASQLRRIIADAAYRNNLLRLQVYQMEDAVLKTKILSAEDLQRVKSNLAIYLHGPNRQSLCDALRQPSGGTDVEAPYDPKVQPDPLSAGK